MFLRSIKWRNIDDECLFETYDRINDVESAIQLLT